MLPHFTDMSFVYVSAAETQDTGFGEEFFTDLYNQLYSQSDDVATLVPIPSLPGDAIKTDGMWVCFVLCGFSF